ncbi:DUF1345 domain-containing protein [Radicibacter daui]|uniref:DUF1345 domain-containing protein n=1 Tax=Radicibacter daui TaxID=3064829 RepID=UPI004046EDB7
MTPATTLPPHLRQHLRFYAALCGGFVVAGLCVSAGFSWRITGLAAGDTFFIVYLALMAKLAAGITAGELRRRASIEDEGMPLIVGITLLAIAFSVSSIFLVLNQKESEPVVQLLLALASVPLGWLVLHTAMAFHYAQLYYARRRRSPKAAAGKKGTAKTADKDEDDEADAGGLTFPGNTEPLAWDFIYHAFVIGMTAQVSDVQVTSRQVRLVVTGHSLAAFFYNTVLLALAVNTAVTLAS